MEARMDVAKSSRTRQVLRWFLRAFLAVMALVVGLIVSDSLHRRTCGEEDLQGQVVELPGERLKFLETGRQTSGQVLAMDTVREPEKDPKFQLRRENGHSHPHQEERFEVISGSARFLIGDRDIVLAAGQTGVVPANTVHHWMALGRVARVVEKHGPSPSGVSTLRDLPRRSVRQVFPSIHPTELYGSAS